jgi:peptidoglycan/xylan/chitin deacetylase (PgdA/CDA1 family)
MHRAGTIHAAALSIVVSILGWVLLAAAPARAQSCPDHPDALGTSRTLVVSPAQYQRLGTMQYSQTLPLADHEVVITFDDGPLPPWSDRTLDILTAQCVKATFFIIGKMARQYPEVVRREYEAGETIGTHSQDHPLNFEKLAGDQLSAQIDGGIASVSAALGDPNDVAPFFRVPGLRRSPVVEDALAARGLVVFSSDVDADDWFHHIKPTQIVARAISRLEKRHRGILLLHDIHPATVAALPLLLQALKDNGFHVVQIVPPAPAGSEMAGGPKAWALAAASPQPGLIDKGAVSPAWPRPNANPATDAPSLPAPDTVAFGPTALLEAGAGLGNGNAATAGWPKLSDSSLSPGATDAQLPALGLPDIGVSLRGETLISIDAEARANPSPTGRPHLRHARLRARHPVRARAGTAHRADLSSGLRSFAGRAAAAQ